MKTHLQARLSQHLALTPQLQQSIRLLQLSTLELHQEVSHMLEANPFLDTDEDEDTDFEASLRASEPSGPLNTAEGPDAGGDTEPAGLQASDFGTTESPEWANGTEHDDFDGIAEMPLGTAGAPADDDRDIAHERQAARPSLADHLRGQLAGRRLSPLWRAALEVLIDSLNDDGHLEDEPEALAAALCRQANAEPTPALTTEVTQVLAQALALLHTLDPVGVGARNLTHCLSLQLEAMTPNPERTLALQLVEHHLEALARRDTKRLMAALHCDEDDLRYAQDLIRQCDPYPGRRFLANEGAPVVPDVIVRRTPQGLRVVLNPDVVPKLRLHDRYAQGLKRQGRAAAPLAGPLQEARWFLKNIQQRFDTILRVATAIVERQRAFFTHGELAMKPMVLREIADELGLHESTISRVTTAKYMATPNGTYELKYFFGSGLSTDAGASASSTAVRALLKQFIAAEDRRKPLSDSHLAELLAEQGIQVARRTVAKYREGLKIAPATHRKAL